MWGGPRRETPRPRDPDSWRVGARAGPPNGGGRDGRLDRSAYTAAAVASPAPPPRVVRAPASPFPLRGYRSCDRAPRGSAASSRQPRVLLCETVSAIPPAARSAPSNALASLRRLPRAQAPTGATPASHPRPWPHAALAHLCYPAHHALPTFPLPTCCSFPRLQLCCPAPPPGGPPIRCSVHLPCTPARLAPLDVLIPSPPSAQHPASTCQPMALRCTCAVAPWSTASSRPARSLPTLPILTCPREGPPHSCVTLHLRHAPRRHASPVQASISSVSV